MTKADILSNTRQTVYQTQEKLKTKVNIQTHIEIDKVMKRWPVISWFSSKRNHHYRHTTTHTSFQTKWLKTYATAIARLNCVLMCFLWKLVSLFTPFSADLSVSIVFSPTILLPSFHPIGYVVQTHTFLIVSNLNGDIYKRADARSPKTATYLYAWPNIVDRSAKANQHHRTWLLPNLSTN